MKKEIRFVVMGTFSPGAYSVCTDLIGVYRCMETAKDKVRRLGLRGIHCQIYTVEVGKEYPVYKDLCGHEDELAVSTYYE